jgi:death on curing protein
MRHLSAEDILVVHALIIDETGGSHGVRDTHLLQSIAYKPQTQFGGRNLYSGIFKKAAILIESIVNYHVFIDGNKRTAFAVGARFLFVNGYEITATNKQVEREILAVATKEIDIEDIEQWLKKNTKKIL